MPGNVWLLTPMPEPSGAPKEMSNAINLLPLMPLVPGQLHARLGQANAINSCRVSWGVSKRWQGILERRQLVSSRFAWRNDFCLEHESPVGKGHNLYE